MDRNGKYEFPRESGVGSEPCGGANHKAVPAAASESPIPPGEQPTHMRPTETYPQLSNLDLP